MRHACSGKSADSEACAVASRWTHTHRRRAPQYLLRSLRDATKVIKPFQFKYVSILTVMLTSDICSDNFIYNHYLQSLDRGEALDELRVLRKLTGINNIIISLYL